MVDPESPEQEVRAAGQGGLAVLFAKGYFIAIGLVQQALLPLVIGIAGYGALSRVLAVSNIFNNVVVASSIQGVSREVASSGVEGDARFRSALRVHGTLAITLAILFAGLAPFVAAFEHASEMLAPLLVMAIVLGVYGFYAPLVGYLNGRRSFVKQASLDVLAATLRTAGLLVAGAIFLRVGKTGALGATVGAAGAACTILVVALWWTRRSASSPVNAPAGFSTSVYLRGLLPVILAQLFTNALMQADILLLGRFLSIGATSTGASNASANEWVGVYRACQLFSFLPYQLLFSITSVLFPMLAKTKAERGDEAVRDLVSKGTRLGLLVCGLLLSAVVFLPESLIRFAFGPAIAMRGASTLRVLAIGQGTFALIGLATTVLVSLGKEMVALGVTISTLLLICGACFVGLPSAEFGAPMLERAALLTTGALTCGLLIAWRSVVHVVGAFVPLRSFARVAAGIALIAVAGRALPSLGRIATIGASFAALALYVLWLLLSREIGSADVAWFKALATRRKASG